MGIASRDMTPWERFAKVARGVPADRIPVALIVDSPWLPGHAGIETLDYFLHPDQWLRINLDLLKRFPNVAWARECVRKTGGQRLILSAGGGASPGTLPEAVDALSHVAMVSESKT